MKNTAGSFQSFKSTSVFSVIGFRQFGHRAVFGEHEIGLAFSGHLCKRPIQRDFGIVWVTMLAGLYERLGLRDHLRIHADQLNSWPGEQLIAIKAAL